MSTTGNTRGLFEIFYGEKPKIIGQFSEFGRIVYIIKRESIRGKMKDKTSKAIRVKYSEKNTRDTYKLYNP